MKNLTDRLKKQSLSNSIKKGKRQSKKMTNIFSPRKKMNKRTKTELFGHKKDLLLFGQQNEINTYNINKSINRQILKNIKITNSNKPKKGISLISKKIAYYHNDSTINNKNINNNTSNNISINTSVGTHGSKNNKTQINGKYIRHLLANSQNSTSIGIINKLSSLPIKEINKKKGVIFPFNNTERSSRNHSKDTINVTIKRNILESFSPKNSQEIIYNKINKVHNKNNTAIISSFLKSVNSNKKIKNLNIKRKKYQNIYINYNSLNNSCKNKEFLKKIN